MPGSEKGSRQYLRCKPPIVSGLSLIAVPFAGQLKEAWLVVDAAPDEATFALAKRPDNHNLQSAATINMTTALTAYTPLALTLATVALTCHLAAGDTIEATTAVTTTGSMTSIQLVVGIDPDQL